MKILYAREPDAEGRHLIYFAVWDRDVFSFARSVNAPVSETTIDEIEANRALRLDLAKTLGKADNDEIKEAFGKTLRITTRESQTAEISRP